MKFNYIFGLFILLFPLSVIANNESLNKIIMGIIEKQYPEAIIITENNFSEQISQYIKPDVIILGDFDFDGSQDVIVQIYHEGRIKLIAIHKFNNINYKIYELSKTGELSLESIKNNYNNFIKFIKKGYRIEFYCECNNKDKDEQALCKAYRDKKSLKGCSIKLKSDAVEWIFYGKGSDLFYFDKKNNKYLSVITGD